MIYIRSIRTFIEVLDDKPFSPAPQPTRYYNEDKPKQRKHKQKSDYDHKLKTPKLDYAIKVIYYSLSQDHFGLPGAIY